MTIEGRDILEATVAHGTLYRLRTTAKRGIPSVQITTYLNSFEMTYSPWTINAINAPVKTLEQLAVTFFLKGNRRKFTPTNYKQEFDNSDVELILTQEGSYSYRQDEVVPWGWMDGQVSLLEQGR